MLRFLPYLVISVIVFTTLFYMQTYERDEFDKLIVQYDHFHWTLIAKDEYQRRQEIDAISDGVTGATQKDTLKQRKVYIGATAQMVRYALQEHPNDGPVFAYPAAGNLKDATGKTVQAVFLAYVYFIGDDKRPTVFIFQCTKNPAECSDYKNHENIFFLNKAYKRATIDLSNPMDLFNN